MVESIVKGVCEVIKKNFDYNIYCEEVRQNAILPCFFVYCKEYSNELYRGKRYRVATDVKVDFYCHKNCGNKKELLCYVAEKVFDAVEVICCDECWLRSVDRKVVIGEDKVEVVVGFEFFYYEKDESEGSEVMEVVEEHISDIGRNLL